MASSINSISSIFENNIYKEILREHFQYDMVMILQNLNNGNEEEILNIYAAFNGAEKQQFIQILERYKIGKEFLGKYKLILEEKE